MSPTPASIEQAVLDAVAAASPAAPASITPATRLLDTCMDSLTLATVLSQIEVVYGVTFEPHEVIELLRADDLGELIAAVARKIGSRADGIRSNSRES
jgi:acyl carrier protein